MANNEIKQKIVLEGEKQYRDAIKDAQRNLKTLRSELKAETAELGANATAQQKNEAKVKSLKKQIQEQQKIVDANRDALEEVKQKYGDNADAVAKYEQKLNDSRTALANMKNELGSVGQNFKQVEANAAQTTVATKSVADSLDKLSEIGDKISSGIEQAFSGLLSTVRETITQIWGEVVDLAARSNNLVDLAGYWNTDVGTIQQYAGAVGEASASLEDLSGLVTKINAKDAKKVAELTGVSSAEYEDQWKYAMAVMDAMSQMDTKTRNAAGFELFGKGATKAFDLLNDWQDKVLPNLGKYSSENYGMSTEDINKMSDLYDQINGIRTSWQYLKDNATVKLFGDIAMDLTSNAQGILDGFMEYMKAETPEERNAALAMVEKNILDMFETAKKAIEDGIALLDKIAEDLKASDNPTAQALGNILGGLVDALQWLTEDNMNNVVKALEILAAFWLAGKGFELATTIAAFAKDLKVIKGFSAVGGIGGATGGAAGGMAGLSIGSLAITAGTVTLIASAFNWAKERRTNTPEVVRGTEENLESFAQDEGLTDAFVNYVNAQKELQDLLNGFGYDDETATALYENVEKAKQALDGLEGAAELLQAYSDWRQEHSYGNMDWLLPDSDWWQGQGSNGGNSGNTDGLTSTDAKDMSGAVRQLPGEIKKSMLGMKVMMDRTVVGQMVADEVSRQIAGYIL